MHTPAHARPASLPRRAATVLIAVLLLLAAAAAVRYGLLLASHPAAMHYHGHPQGMHFHGLMHYHG